MTRPDDPSAPLSRRRFVQLLGATALVGCSSDDPDESTDATPAPDASRLSDAGVDAQPPDASMMAEEVEVLVIGAGLSGLCAATRLQAAGHQVAVVEARDRTGGRTLNQPLAGGGVVDGGGQWIGGSQSEVLALAQALGVATLDQHTEGEGVYHTLGMRFRFDPQMSPGEGAQQAMAELERLAESVVLDAPWTTPDAAALDGQSLQAWLDAQVPAASDQEPIVTTALSTLGALPSDISLLWFLFYLGSAGGFDQLDQQAQSQRFVGGAQLLSLRLAEQLGGPVITGAPVRQIRQIDQGRLAVQTDVGVWHASRVIVAMSPKDAGRIEFDPPLPEARQRLQQRWVGSAGFKMHAIYPEPFWRAEGLSGFGVVESGLVEETFDSSPADGGRGVLLAFLSNAASELSPEVRRSRALDDLAGLFGEAARTPLEVVEQDWADDPWSGGCVSPLPPGVVTGEGAALKQPIAGIHWAGTETSDVWNGYLEGAVRAGYRAADEVGAALQGG